MKITNWKRAVLSAFVSAAAMLLAVTIFTYIVNFILDGERFNVGFVTASIVNGIPATAVFTACIILGALLPLFLLRYASTKFLLAYFPLTLIFYAVLFFFQWQLLGAFYNSFIYAPLNSFDYLGYCLLFPIGTAGGMIISIVINEIRNRKTR